MKATSLTNTKTKMRCWCGKQAKSIFNGRPVCPKHEWKEKTEPRRGY